MKTMLRLALTMLLCFIVYLCVAPAAFAENIVASGTCGAQGDNLTWTLDNKGTLTISGTGAMQDYFRTGSTPPTRPWEDYWRSIKKLVVNNGVTDLGVNAFAKMFELQSVMLPEGINNLPHGVFCDCRRLSHINFPSSLTTLDNECLWNTGIDTLFLPTTVTTVYGHFYGGMLGAASKRFETAPDHPVFTAIDGVLFTKDLSTLVMFPCCDLTAYTVPDGTAQIREHAFAFNDTLEILRVPATVAFIGEGAFFHCTGLQTAGPLDGDYNIKFGWTDSIPDYAFDGCTGLKSITIPNSVTSIGEYAFRDCTGLKSITIPNSVTSIGDDAFWRCTGLKSITIPNSVTSIGEYAFFYCTGLKSITIPNSVTSISDGTFGCTGLKSITIPNSVTSIGDIAFWGSAGLTDIYYGGTQEQWLQIDIGYDNEILTSATIHYLTVPDFILPANLITIEQEAFAGGAFSYTKLSDNTVSIAQRAFADCPNLIYIYIPEATTSIDPNAFGDLSILTIFGKTGSTAETFAQTHGFTFVAVS